jgi:hypothetical protein
MRWSQAFAKTPCASGNGFVRGFEWLGLKLDETRNEEGEMIVSSDRSRVRVA